MSRFKKGIAAVVGVCAIAGGGVAAATALAGGSTWGAGNCSAAAQSSLPQSKTVYAIYSGMDANGQACSASTLGWICSAS